MNNKQRKILEDIIPKPTSKSLLCNDIESLINARGGKVIPESVFTKSR